MDCDAPEREFQWVCSSLRKLLPYLVTSSSLEHENDRSLVWGNSEFENRTWAFTLRLWNRWKNAIWKDMMLALCRFGSMCEERGDLKERWTRKRYSDVASVPRWTRSLVDHYLVSSTGDAGCTETVRKETNRRAHVEPTKGVIH